MDETIKTKYIKSGYAEVDGEIKLDETPTTRTIARRAMTPKGIRAEIVRQKKNRNGEFVDLNEVNFQSVPADSGVKIDIPSDGLKALAIDLYKLFKTRSEQGVQFGEHEYVIADRKNVIVIDDTNVQTIIEKLISGGYSESFWKELSESDGDLAKKFADAKQQRDRLEVIKEFRENIDNADESFWQGFFEKNSWIIQLVFSSPIIYLSGETLLGGKNTSGRNGQGGVATDFLCADETSKSFSVVEIKTPCTQLVGSTYRGKGTPNEIFAPHGELTGSLVQVQKQVKTAMEDFSTYLGKDYKELNYLHPHSVVIIGKLSDIEDANKIKSFNLFRHSLHATTIITYDELLRRLEVVYG